MVDRRAPKLSIPNPENEKETEKVLKRRLKVCDEDKNELKTKVMRPEEDFLARDVTAKAMALQPTRLEQGKTKLITENKSFRVVKRK